MNKKAFAITALIGVVITILIICSFIWPTVILILILIALVMFLLRQVYVLLDMKIPKEKDPWGRDEN